ncbi:hypothetical protein F2Q69_00024882 [Brassica cretica]|uniref:RNase H type-1 domain-containing protein n=1 Tax=Brassica cretica TaxID=69181 RepID=A0A8S9QGA8_BRACR|nr:hypothetical protein F2Q69_00024882 [Brassica cretica]
MKRPLMAADVINKSIANAREREAAQVKSGFSLKHWHQVSDVAWTPRISPGHVVCHVDAASHSSSGNYGIGGNFSGCGAAVPITISDSRSSVSSALMGEVLAVRKAVMIASASNV